MAPLSFFMPRATPQGIETVLLDEESTRANAVQLADSMMRYSSLAHKEADPILVERQLMQGNLASVHGCQSGAPQMLFPKNRIQTATNKRPRNTENSNPTTNYRNSSMYDWPHSNSSTAYPNSSTNCGVPFLDSNWQVSMEAANVWMSMSSSHSQPQKQQQNGIGNIFRLPFRPTSTSRAASTLLQDLDGLNATPNRRATSRRLNPEAQVWEPDPGSGCLAPPGRTSTTTRNGRKASSRRVDPDQSTTGSNPAFSKPSWLSHDRKRNPARNKMAKMEPESGSKWRSAKDPKSGKTYYYHIETRETQWRKPPELATPEERKTMEDKEKKQKDFFAAMEANILKNLSQGSYSPPSTITHQSEPEKTSPATPPPAARPTLQRPNFVRTISTMEESVLADLVRRQPSHRLLITDDDALYESAGFNASSSSRFQHSFVSGDTFLSPIDERRASLAKKSSAVDSVEEEDLEDEIDIPNSIRAKSFKSLLMDLPVDNEERTQNLSSSYGSSGLSGLTESQASLFMTLDESQALHDLASISDEMALIDIDDDDAVVGLDALPETDDPSDSEKEGPDGAPSKEHPPLERSMGSLQLGEKKGSLSQIPKAQMGRRNTCSTIYVGTTMAQPDKDATIKCVCGVIRAHILQSEMENEQVDNKYLIFNDVESQRKAYSVTFRKVPAPSLDEVTTFYRDIFRRAQMETDCIIMSLIYIERLIKVTVGALRPRSSNWMSVVFSCLILSSKVWDDLSMWNADFSQASTGVNFSLQRINELEIAVLEALSYEVKVPASEYAKYYFLLRSMLIKSGLGGDDLKTMDPLDIQGAKRLQQASSIFQTLQKTSGATRMPKPGIAGRSKSVSSIQGPSISSVDFKGKVSLEHVVKM